MAWFSDCYIDINDISAVYDWDGNLICELNQNTPDKLYPEKDCDKHDKTVSENFFVRMLKAWKRHRNVWERETDIVGIYKEAKKS